MEPQIKLLILFQTVDISVGIGLVRLLLDHAEGDVGAVVAHALKVVKQIWRLRISSVR